MPKIYEDSTMQMVWEMVHKDGMRRREIAEFFDADVATIENIYAAAERKFGKRNAPVKRTIIQMKPVAKFERIKGQYSNCSPMGIANPGMNEEN